MGRRPIVFVDLDETLVYAEPAPFGSGQLCVHYEEYNVTVRDYAPQFLSYFRSVADVCIFSAGAPEYIDAVLRYTGLERWVNGYFSARRDVLHALTEDCAWVLVDNMPLGSDFIANKLGRLSSQYPNIDTSKHFVQAAEFNGIQDLELAKLPALVMTCLDQQRNTTVFPSAAFPEHKTLSQPLQLRRDYGKESTMKTARLKRAALSRSAQNAPTDPKLWEKVLDLARGDRKELEGYASPNEGAGFRVWPSQYGSQWATKVYNELGGTWKKKASRSKAACIIATSEWGGKRCLLKNRDRNYMPKLKIVRDLVQGVEVAYIEDEVTKWCEGLNEHGIGIVNSALSVYDDEIEGFLKLDRDLEKMDGPKIIKALSCSDLEDAVNSLLNFRTGLNGHTFVCTPEEGFLIEKPQEQEAFVKALTMNQLHVRTNHGIFHDGAGYTEADRDGMPLKSSEIRREKAKKILRQVKQPQDIATVRMNLSADEHFAEDSMVRFGDYENKDMCTSSQMVLNLDDLEMLLYVIPQECEFLHIENRLPKNYTPKIEIRVFQHVGPELSSYLKQASRRVADRWLRAKERTDEEKDEIYKKWKDLINMSQAALDEWGEDPERLEASLNRNEAKDMGKIQSGYDSFRRIQRRKEKPRKDWSADDYDNAAQENGFNTRMLGGNPGDVVKGTDKSKWEISLRNWGHDPSLKSSPAYDKWKKWRDDHEDEIEESLASKEDE